MSALDLQFKPKDAFLGHIWLLCVSLCYPQSHSLYSSPFIRHQLLIDKSISPQEFLMGEDMKKGCCLLCLNKQATQRVLYTYCFISQGTD